LSVHGRTAFALFLRCCVVLLRAAINGPVGHGAAARDVHLALPWLIAAAVIGALCALSLLLLFRAWTGIGRRSAARANGQSLF
jgi:hypothetical protein